MDKYGQMNVNHVTTKIPDNFQVIRHEIHFGIVKAIMAARRMRYFDYSTFQFFGMGKLATLKPKPVDEFLKIFAPLRPITWTSFLTVFICVSSTMVVLKSIHPRVDKDSVCSFQVWLKILAYVNNLHLVRF